MYRLLMRVIIPRMDCRMDNWPAVDIQNHHMNVETSALQFGLVRALKLLTLRHRGLTLVHTSQHPNTKMEVNGK